MLLDPKPEGVHRAAMAKQIRHEAGLVASQRTPPTEPPNNGEAHSLHPPIATFTKSLPHDVFGFVDGAAFTSLVDELNQTDSSDKFAPFPRTYGSQTRAPFEVTLAPKDGYAAPRPGETGPRRYESPLAGHTFDLEGPDAGALAIPPAPVLGSDELVAEMAEVYTMALLRDAPFSDFRAGGTDKGAQGYKVGDAVSALQSLSWFDGTAKGEGGPLNERETARREARTLGEPLSEQTLFRGSTRGAQVGPYLSQFLVRGNRVRGEGVDDGEPTQAYTSIAEAGSKLQGKATQEAYNVAAEFAHPALAKRAADAGHEASVLIQYGQQTVSQEMIPHAPEVDFMTNWADWLDVQNGLDTRKREKFLHDGTGKSIARLITTPRDLATYVHYDALYQAYLNACLILLGQAAPIDAGLPEGDGHPTRTGFATFGGPHILTLVTEVATRALKAVRRQKFQVHLRARPEAIGGALTLASSQHRPADHHGKPVDYYGAAERMIAELTTAGLKAALSERVGEQALLKHADRLEVHGENAGQFLPDADNWLLPMAFPEGSPIHGSYGAGHATVAGACVTILKAFFEMFDLDDPQAYRKGEASLTDLIGHGKALFAKELALDDAGSDAVKGVYEPQLQPDGTAKLVAVESLRPLTLQGELDKLAANISIGRDFAGVHYYTDYYESLRLGERIAVGILQEQMLTYREPVSMRLTSFDGDYLMIAGRGGTFHGRQDHEADGYDRDDALVLVWPYGKDGPHPQWASIDFADETHWDKAVKAEAAKWWTRGLGSSGHASAAERIAAE